jgi:polyhydroxyalkanoate synthesis repressor PhaR
MRVRNNYQRFPYSVEACAALPFLAHQQRLLIRDMEHVMNNPRQIRKYPNRRLYDTAESRYMTIADIRKLVVDGVEFSIIDKKSQQDITDRILMQVVSEQEQSGEPMFGREFLLQTIRLYGSPLQGAVGECLRQNVSSLVLQSRDTHLRQGVPVMAPQSERSEIAATAVLKAH